MATRGSARAQPVRSRLETNQPCSIPVRQTVIQLSLALKTRGTTAGSTPAALIAAGAGANNPLSSTLRTKIVRLTQATQEFVMLLHVSSFSPAPTPGLRSYSPMVGMLAPQPSPLPITPSVFEDGRLGSNLSRNRSANPAGTRVL